MHQCPWCVSVVLCSRAEIMQAMMDYQSGTNGFEKAPTFESEISRGF